MIAPNPENTGRAARVPNVPQGSSGYVAPGGQVLYPGDAGGGSVPWSGASGLTSLLQTIAGSGLGSLFGVNGPGGQGETGSLGPGSPVSGSQLVDFMSTLFQMPIMNQYSGNFGSRNDDAGAAIANFAATLHRMGDPTGGRVPGTAKNDPNIPGPAEFAAHARAVGAQIMKQWMDYGVHEHGPHRDSPIRGGPHAQWAMDNTDAGPDAGDAGKKDPAPPTTYVTPGGTQGTSPGGSAGGSTTSQPNTGYSFPNDPPPPKGPSNETVATVVSGVVTGFVTFELGPVPGIAAGLVTYLVAKSILNHIHLNWFPSDDGGGVGPRSSPAATAYMPDPETGSGGGPRGYGVMPDPESGSGGGPRGTFYFPDPDGGGVGPRS